MIISSLIVKTTNQRLLALANSTRYAGIIVNKNSINTKASSSNQPTNTSIETAKTTTTTLPTKQSEQQRELQEFKVDRALLYPEQMEWLDERQVRISKPTKNVMQSGTAYMNTWRVEFDSKQRWEDWLMGWTSSGDPMSNLVLNFSTKEDAIAFCEKNKLSWFVEEPVERKIRRKSYADNFSWNKRTRLGNK